LKTPLLQREGGTEQGQIRAKARPAEAADFSMHDFSGGELSILQTQPAAEVEGVWINKHSLLMKAALTRLIPSGRRKNRGWGA
jgi:hypothetical protein